nr:MAG TPA: hypothetical protein [Caudoviricetes sp.]
MGLLRYSPMKISFLTKKQKRGTKSDIKSLFFIL